MRAHLLLLFGIALCIRPSTSQTQQFRQCRDNSDCPQGARCVDTNGQDYYGNDMGRCQCTSGLYPYIGETRLTYDLGVMDQQTVSCRGMNSCTQYDQDCGPYGYCEEVQGRYYCRCRDGYSGERCEIPGMNRRGLGNILPLIGAGVAALVLLGVGGAALSSLSG
uniref:Adhesion G protein-coupled receptor E1-like n=1 Tax=Crassostrea virginica TaxID=6565 RepID=A0A8B8C6W1_CRAVI|nr:adhesion G protein-coupled receptor E1-like [Crassostrea virginica]